MILTSVGRYIISIALTAAVCGLLIKAAEFPSNCNASQPTTWSLVSQDTSRQRLVLSELRCRLGCDTVISRNEYPSTELSQVCVSGCLTHSRNSSISITHCHQSCLNESNSTLCQIGCNVSANFLQRSRKVDIAVVCPLLTQAGGGLKEGQYAFISEGDNCRVYTCMEGPTLQNVSFGCDALSRMCPLNGDEMDIGLAECCGYCGGLPIEPSSPPEFIIGNQNVEVILPPTNSTFMMAAEAVLVRVRIKSNDSAVTFIPLVNTSSRRVSFVIPHLACTEIAMDYAAVNLRGVSSFSPIATWTVNPGPVNNITVAFNEDISLPQRANLNLTWETPILSNLLYGYEVIIEPTDPRLFCQRQSTYRAILDKDDLSLVLTTNNTNKFYLPLYDCDYRINITSLPGEETFTKDVQIKYKASDRKPITVSCDSQYRPGNITYDIIVSWNVDPLAAEAIQSYEILFYEQRRFSPGVRYRPRSVTDMRTVFNADILSERDSLYVAELRVVRNNTLFWRRPLVPGTRKLFTCNTPAPPHPPSPIDDVRTTDLNFFTSGVVFILSLVAEWSPPVYSNGNLEEFELRVGSCIDEDMLVWERQHVDPVRRTHEISLAVRNISDLCLRIRSRNSFNLFSNWSSPLSLEFLETETTLANTDVTVNPDFASTLPTYAYALIGVAVVFVGVVLCVLVIVCCVRLGRRQSMKFDPIFIPTTSSSSIKRGPGTLWASYNSHILLPVVGITDQWEIPFDEIRVFDSQPLGKGCFGEVYKGHLSRKTQSFGIKQMPKYSLTCTVAVKRLKDHAAGAEKDSFLKEIEMMKRVTDTKNEYSRFVVNMVGCMTVKEPLLLVLEYVQHGDLLRYLRAMKKRLVDSSGLQVAAPYLEPEGAYSHLNPRDIYEDLDLLEEKDLLEFSRQIAAGMEYLSGLGIVHRDLACRNILVGDHKNLKISDFGMSRNVPSDEVYVQTTLGPLPIRWMSIEAIFQREYNTASDVWSYGIVLWEICTMGAVPYPAYNNHGVINAVKQGYRMPKPEKCSTEVYEIMLHCWCEISEDRCSFSKLRKRFDHFLSVYVQERHPYIEIPDQSYQFDRLAPETGQVGRNSFLDGGDNSPINLDEGGGIVDKDTRTDEQRKERSPCRLSMLSSSMELLTDRHSQQPPSRGHSSTSLDSHISPHSPTANTPRYVRSPLTLSGSLFAGDFSFEGDLISQLDRRLSTISVRRHKEPELTNEPEAEKNEEKLESMTLAAGASVDTIIGDSKMQDDEQVKEETSLKSKSTTESEGDEISGGEPHLSGRRESLLERKKRDYFKFSLLPSQGVQFSDDSQGSTKSSREVLI